MKNRRKLIKYSIFKEIVRKATDGVPYTKLVKAYDLDISSQHLAKLIKQYLVYAANSTRTPLDQFNPGWLNESGHIVQEPPAHVAYKGLFPWGQWIEKDVA